MKIIYLFALGCLIATMGYSQHLISGTVRDANTGETMPGASIAEKGTPNGVYAAEDGSYQLNLANENATLTVKYIGYFPQEIQVEKKSILNIVLKASSVRLEENVVTALSVKRQSKALGYTVQHLNGKEISEVINANFVDNLAGKVAGVTVSQGATGIGSTSKITIRGEASFTNNNPLFVVDGTPINNSSIVNFTNDAAAGFQEVDFGNGAMEVNPNDIASISILKGPGAAALYGTRASNGVILITTKDGSRQKGLGLSFNSSTFVEQAFKLPEFQNKYGQGNSGQFEFVDGLGGGVNDNITYSWGPALDQGLEIAQYDSPVTLPDGSVVRGGDVAVHGGETITPSAFDSHPDNLKKFYQTGLSTLNNISLSSGFDKGSFRLSYTDFRNKSIIPGANLDRQTIAGSFNFQPTQRLKISSRVNYIHSSSDNRPSGGYGSENINYSLVAWGPRSMDTETLRDYWQPGLEQVQQYSFNYTFFDNPFFILNENRNSFGRDRLFGNISATYELNQHFSLSLRNGMDYSNEIRRFRRAFSSNRFKNGAYAEHTVFFRELNSDFLLNYEEEFGDFSLIVSAGGNQMNQQSASVQAQALSLAQPGVFKLSNAASPVEIFDFESRKRINSLYGIAKLGYRDFLYLDITGRNDWSSALASPISAQNTSFFYPSVSSSFVVSNVLDLPEAINFAKLRISWAQVGNDTDPFQTAGVFQAQTPYNGQPTFSDQSTIASSALLPERTTSIEIGTDLRFFADRLRLDATYYNTTTKNQIISLPIPVSSGYTDRVINGGAVRSRGFEIVLGVTPIANPTFRWNTTFNFSQNIATVESLPEGTGTLTLAYSRVYDNANQTVWFQVQEGGRIGEMYGTGYLKNENGDFVVDNNGKYIVNNELILLGNYNPDFILGMSNSFHYKDFDLGFLLDWRKGGQLVSRTLALAGVAGQLIETESRPDAGIIAEGVLNVGTDENPIWEANTTPVSAETYYRQYYDRNHEENNVYNASYLKLRELSWGYTFRNDNEKGFFQKGRSLRLAITGRNLFAISQIPHFDPEQLAVQGQKFISGVEDMSYATSRGLGIKIGLNF